MIEVVVCEMRRQDDDNTISHYITYCTGYTSLSHPDVLGLPALVLVQRLCPHMGLVL